MRYFVTIEDSRISRLKAKVCLTHLKTCFAVTIEDSRISRLKDEQDNRKPKAILAVTIEDSRISRLKVLLEFLVGLKHLMLQ